MTIGNLHDLVNIARNSGIIDRHDHLGLWSDESLNLGVIDIHGLRVNIAENWEAAKEHDGVDCRRESV